MNFKRQKNLFFVWDKSFKLLSLNWIIYSFDRSNEQWMTPTFVTTFRASDSSSILTCPVGLNWSRKPSHHSCRCPPLLGLVLCCMKENRAERAPAGDKNGNDQVFGLFYMQEFWLELFFHGQKNLLLITSVAPQSSSTFPTS